MAASEVASALSHTREYEENKVYTEVLLCTVKAPSDLSKRNNYFSFNPTITCIHFYCNAPNLLYFLNDYLSPFRRGNAGEEGQII